MLWALPGSIVLLLSCLASAQNGALPPAGTGIEYRIDPSTRYQTIDHFGASDCWSMQAVGQWSQPNRERVAELLFSRGKGIGLSLWRFNVAAGLSTNIRNSWRTSEGFETARGEYDWSRQPGQRWFLRAAKRYGVPAFLAFCNSPPIRLTRNGLANLGDDTSHTSNLQPGAEADFARYMADIVGHFHANPDPAEQITFNWISPINEPQWGWTGTSQEGCRASNADIGRVAAALAHELHQRRLPTRMHLIESGNIGDLTCLNEKATHCYGSDYGSYIDVLCNDPAATPTMGRVIGYHSYWSDSADRLVPQREALRRKLLEYPGWSVWQTEYCVMERKRDLGMDTALRVARVIHADLTVAGVSGWSWWLAVSSSDYKDGLIFTDFNKPGDAETIHPSKLLWTLGQFSRFVRPGMQRVDISEGAPGRSPLLASAYADQRTRDLVVVYINCTKLPIGVRLNLRPGPDSARPVTWTPYVTSASPDDNLRRLPAHTAGDAVTIPAGSIVTLVGGR